MRERQTVVLLHPGPGLRPRPLQGADRPVALGRDAGRLHRPARRRPQRPEHAGGTARRALGGRRQGAVRRASGSSARSCSASASARSSRSSTPPATRSIRPRSCSPRRSRASCPERSIAAYERLGGEDARAVAERFYEGMDEQGFADFLRVCFPLLSSYRAHERRDRPRRLEPGGADGVDARRGEGARPARRARHDPRAGARAGRGGGRVGAARARCRRSTSCSAGTSASAAIRMRTPLRLPRRARGLRGHAALPRRHPGAGDARREGRRQRGRALLRRRGREGPARRALDARPPDGDPAADGPRPRPLALQGQPRPGARGGRPGDLPRPARRRPERLELARALDDRDVGRRSDGVLRDARGAAAGAARNRASAA